MAMIKCSECKKRVSDAAFSCPKCGATKDAMTKSKDVSAKTGLIIVASVASFAGLAVISNPQSDVDTLAADLVAQPASPEDDFQRIAVISDPGAQYWIEIITAMPSDPFAVVSTKRVGSSDETHNMRIYNCDDSTVAYLRDEQDTHEALMSAPNYMRAEIHWAPILKGSIAFYIGVNACEKRVLGS